MTSRLVALAERSRVALYASTTFLSSFLLFLVQPLIARCILPWFGGSAAVWITCMLFFEALLLAGYAYAHVLQRYAKGWREPFVHTLLLLAAVVTLPIAPSEAWRPTGGEEPVTRILLLLLATIGMPYFVLAANGPLLQAWLARARPGARAYRLFALSNLGSLVALLAYPLLLEPDLGSAGQARLWSWSFAAFAVPCALATWLRPRDVATAMPAEGATSARGASPWRLWLGLSATGSVLLLAVTNHLTQNVAAVPLLWLVPLTLYLASFVLTFERAGWYRLQWLWPVLLASLCAMAWILVAPERYRLDLPVQLAVFLPGLFLGCLLCHGELHRLRPPPRRLTAFYLWLAAGGALGGLLVAVVAPLVYRGEYELGIVLVAVGALAAHRLTGLGGVARRASLAVLLAIAGCAAWSVLVDKSHVLFATRGFYGTLRVEELGRPGDAARRRVLMHGAIKHGEQYAADALRRLPTTYYHEDSGVGAAIASLGAAPAHVGVIGLGIGTLAAYGRAGDVYRFYEIDPRVVAVAQRDFTYLRDSAATIELAEGDARLLLEREPPRRFDVLAVDAFSGDAIPVHLLTREALGVYLRHTKPDGIVAFHLSNRFLDLVPVLARLTHAQGAHAVLVRYAGDARASPPRSPCEWVLVSRDRAALERAAIVKRGAVTLEDRPDLRTWTDDYSNVVATLK